MADTPNASIENTKTPEGIKESLQSDLKKMLESLDSSDKTGSSRVLPLVQKFSEKIGEVSSETLKEKQDDLSKQMERIGEIIQSILTPDTEEGEEVASASEKRNALKDAVQEVCNLLDIEYTEIDAQEKFFRSFQKIDEGIIQALLEDDEELKKTIIKSGEPEDSVVLEADHIKEVSDYYVAAREDVRRAIEVSELSEKEVAKLLKDVEEKDAIYDALKPVLNELRLAIEAFGEENAKDPRDEEAYQEAEANLKSAIAAHQSALDQVEAATDHFRTIPDTLNVREQAEKARLDEMERLKEKMVNSATNYQQRIDYYNQLLGKTPRDIDSMGPEEQKIINEANNFMNSYLERAYMGSREQEREVIRGFMGSKESFGKSVLDADAGDIARAGLVMLGLTYGMYKLFSKNSSKKGRLFGAALVALAAKGGYDYAHKGRFMIENAWDDHAQIERKRISEAQSNIENIDKSVPGLYAATLEMRMSDAPEGQLSLKEYFEKKSMGSSENFKVTETDLAALLGKDISEVPKISGNPLMQKFYYTQLHILYAACMTTNQETVQGSIDALQMFGWPRQALRLGGEHAVGAYDTAGTAVGDTTRAVGEGRAEATSRARLVDQDQNNSENETA